MNINDLPPGAIIPGSDEPVTINASQPSSSVRITNTGGVPVHLTAHYHVLEANRALRFDRRKAFGMRPDVPAGGAIRIEPGATVDVPLVLIGGRRIVRGFHGLIDGPLDEVDVDHLISQMVQRGFLNEPEE